MRQLTPLSPMSTHYNTFIHKPYWTCYVFKHNSHIRPNHLPVPTWPDNWVRTVVYLSTCIKYNVHIHMYCTMHMNAFSANVQCNLYCHIAQACRYERWALHVYCYLELSIDLCGQFQRHGHYIQRFFVWLCGLISTTQHDLSEPIHGLF